MSPSSLMRWKIVQAPPTQDCTWSTTGTCVRLSLFIFMSVAILLALFWVDSAGLIPVNQFTYMSLFGIILFTFLNIGMMAWRVRSFNSQLEMQVVARTRELVQERDDRRTALWRQHIRAEQGRGAVFTVRLPAAGQVKQRQADIS
jgi:hypothetical protein